MAKSDLLARLRNTSDLARVVPQLPPEILHRIIQAGGLEDCGDLVALATPQQIAKVLDVDLWRGPRAGHDEEFDADRFGLWIEVLMDAGGEVAAGKLRGLDLDLVVAGLSRHAAVYDRGAVTPYMTTDGVEIPGRRLTGMPACDVGGYVVEARRPGSWDAIVELLRYLDGEHAEFFGRVMRGCLRLSDGAREPDGFHLRLEDDAQAMFDLASEREARRDKQGYVAPSHARAFLQMSRQLRLDDEQVPPDNPIVRAYFRAVEWAAPADADATEAAEPGASEAVAGVVEVLRDAGVLAQPPRALLEAPQHQPSRLGAIREYLESHAAASEALGFLANTIAAGCSIQSRVLSAQEASDCAAAVCNLGLENWPDRWPDVEIIRAFQVGWTILHRDVCMDVAQRLIEVLADLRCMDRDIQMRLAELRVSLTRHCRDESPWRARDQLEAIVMLDAPSWAALTALLDECPVVHAAIGALRGSSARAIDMTAFEFISENSQIAAIRDFVKGLPETLTR